jgi:hypothetical protein
MDLQQKYKTQYSNVDFIKLHRFEPFNSWISFSTSIKLSTLYDKHSGSSCAQAIVMTTNSATDPKTKKKASKATSDVVPGPVPDHIEHLSFKDLAIDEDEEASYPRRVKVMRTRNQKMPMTKVPTTRQLRRPLLTSLMQTAETNSV